MNSGKKNTAISKKYKGGELRDAQPSTIFTFAFLLLT